MKAIHTNLSSSPNFTVPRFVPDSRDEDLRVREGAVIDARPYFASPGASRVESLIRLGECFRPETEQLLGETALGEGASALDLACGPRGILAELSRALGPEGRLVGMDREQEFLFHAAEEWESRGTGDVELMQGDVHATGLADRSFDFVHARLVLAEQSNPGSVVKEMIRLTRPGGVVVLHEMDWSTWACEPMLPAWEELQSLAEAAQTGQGRNVFVGQEVSSLLSCAGVAEVREHVHHHLFKAGANMELFAPSLSEDARQRAVMSGWVREGDIDRLEIEIRDHLLDPRTAVSTPTFVQAWGRKI